MKWLVIKSVLLASPCIAFLVELAMVRYGLRPGRRFLGWFAAIGLLAACKFVGFTFLGGNDFNPELPLWLIVGWGWLESVIWVGLPVGTVVVLVAWAWRPFRRFAFPFALAASVTAATYGMWEGLRVPPVVEKEVEVEGLPKDFDGYRIVHLSDLHCSSAARRAKIAAIVDRVNAAKPDLVAITGDLVDGFPAERRADLEPLKDLRAPDGVYVSAGNHERYFRIDEWMPLYREWGLRVLRNGWTDIRRPEGALLIAGEDDGRPSERLFQGAPDEGCRILLRHRPVGCEAVEREMNVRLQLSGHTHGGAMPVISAFVSRANEGRVRGLYRIGRLALHVSPGTGQWAGFPLRFFNPPEISVLVLRPR